MLILWTFVCLCVGSSLAQFADDLASSSVQVEPVSDVEAHSFQALADGQPVTHLNFSVAPIEHKAAAADLQTRFLTPGIWESMGRLFLTQSQLSACSSCTPVFTQQATACCTQGFTGCCFNGVSPYSGAGASSGSYAWTSPSVNYGYGYSNPYGYGQSYGYGSTGYGSNGYGSNAGYGNPGYYGTGYGSSGYGSNGYVSSGYNTNGQGIYSNYGTAGASTVGYARAGTCPFASPYSSQTCSRQCTYDTDCSGDYKCCAFGCSFICARPHSSGFITTSHDKPGTCPSDYSTVVGPNDVYYRGAPVKRAYYGKNEFGYGGGGSSGGLIAACTRDSDCPGNQKCCLRQYQRICHSPNSLSYGR